MQYIATSLQNSKSVHQLHREIVESVNDIRSDEPAIVRSDREYTQRQKEYIEKYGYANVLEEYEPHLTFIRYLEESLATTVKASVSDTIFPEVTFDRIALIEWGDTKATVVNEFRLSA